MADPLLQPGATVTWLVPSARTEGAYVIGRGVVAEIREHTARMVQEGIEEPPIVAIEHLRVVRKAPS